MNFSQMKIAIEMLEKYGGCDENDEPLGGRIESDHDQVWITPSRLRTPEFPPEARTIMEQLGWFYDEANDAWSHFT